MNGKRKRLSALLFLALAPAFLSGCAALTQISEHIFLMTPEQEAALGKEIAVEIEKQHPVYRADPAATAYIQGLGKRLVEVAPPCEQQFRFQLVDSEEPNAFAIPGGNCYVNVGLLRLAENESELASVVAHEIGHVILRHGAKTVSQAQTYGLIGQLALGESAGQLSQVAAKIVQSGVLLQNSRAHELEADNVAVTILANAAVDPQGLLAFFDRMQSLGGGAGRNSKFSEYFSTHPLTGTRIDIARQRIQALGAPDPGWSRDSEAFRQVKTRYPPAE